MKNAGLSSNEINAKAQLQKDIEDIRAKLSKNESEFTNEKNKLQTEIAKLKDLNTKLEGDKTKITDKCKSLETEKDKSLTELKTLKDEKKSLEAQITKLNADLSKNYTTFFSYCLIRIISSYENI